MNVEEEVGRLKEEIKRLGKPQDDGSYKGSVIGAPKCVNEAPKSTIPVRGMNSDFGAQLTNTEVPITIQVTFGVLFNDDRCANIFEALVGTLRAAKRRKILTYDGELLLQGVHDNVEIVLKPEATPSDAVVKS